LSRLLRTKQVILISPVRAGLQAKSNFLRDVFCDVRAFEGKRIATGLHEHISVSQRRSSVPFICISVLYKHISVLHKRISLLHKHISVLLKHISVLHKYVNVLLKHKSVLHKRIRVLLKHISEHNLRHFQSCEDVS
jgi:hypothetical protein